MQAAELAQHEFVNKVHALDLRVVLQAPGDHSHAGGRGASDRAYDDRCFPDLLGRQPSVRRNHDNIGIQRFVTDRRGDVLRAPGVIQRLDCELMSRARYEDNLGRLDFYRLHPLPFIGSVRSALPNPGEDGLVVGRV